MLENMHSDHTALSDSEIEPFIIDPNSLPPVDDSDYQVEVSLPQIDISDDQIPQLLDPIHDDGNSGKYLYLQCVNDLKTFFTSGTDSASA